MQSNFTATKDELLRSLSESKKNLNEAIHLWPLIVAAFTAIAKKKGPKQAKAIMSEFIRRLPPGAGVSEIVAELIAAFVAFSRECVLVHAA